MVKYYKRHAVAVVGKVENGNLAFKTWFELRPRVHHAIKYPPTTLRVRSTYRA